MIAAPVPVPFSACGIGPVGKAVAAATGAYGDSVQALLSSPIHALDDTSYNDRLHQPPRRFGRYSLNTEAASGFLLSVSCDEARPQVQELSPTTFESKQSCYSSGHLSESEFVESQDLGLRNLKVSMAERFLLSLEVGMFSEDDINKVKSTQSLELENWDAEEIVEGNRATEIVIGGWRNRADLNRIMPGLIKKGLVGGRVIVSSQRSSIYISSTRPPPISDDTSHAQEAINPLAKSRIGSFSKPWVFLAPLARRDKNWAQVSGISYARSLVPTNDENYDPDFLDDPSLKQGKHHTVLRLESYQVSVIPFVRPYRLKEELNDQFRRSHAEIHPSITLSKLRNLQKDLRQIHDDIAEVDMSTVALAWVYFEKLVLKDRVRKGNRKLLAGACLVLAFKFNQHGEKTTLKKLAAAIRRLDRKDQLNLDALHDAELEAFVWLEFGLHVGVNSVLPHLLRFLQHSVQGTSFEDYYHGRFHFDDLGNLTDRTNKARAIAEL
eukprot:TRINITY_DN36452_c0_g1_i1.p1 TRINITY_DN36452_c0_g1~~TRINITY_DN36452_c0_g1_i1.p1  ORF type:complete len:495 (+),score=81.72 TRINITY_DN36452_c0_g1_i1:176-1660(+)